MIEHNSSMPRTHIGGEAAWQAGKALRANVLAFYGDLSKPFATKKDKKDWKRTVQAVEKLRSSVPAPRSCRESLRSRPVWGTP